MEENLHEGHRERIKDRFIKEGAESFNDHQLLELILFYSVPRKDTNELAHKMINTFGSLSRLIEAHPKDICNACKVSESTAVLVSLLSSIALRYKEDKILEEKKRKNEQPLNNVTNAGMFCKTLFIGKKYEYFYLICLNSQNRVIQPVQINEGTVNEVPVYPRRVIEAALRHKAHGVILAHNHPGGSLTPSQDDINITNAIIAALDPIDIKVRDHFIVAGDDYFSMKQNNCF